MTLNSARKGRIYTVQKVDIGDSKTEAFLFSLGLFSGENICVISRVRGGLIVAIGRSKYCIDSKIARGVII